MKPYRPEGFIEIVNRKLREMPPCTSGDPLLESMKYYGEVHADAMLEGLKKEGTHLLAHEPIYLYGHEDTDYFEVPGYLLFIPEDKS